MHPRCTKPKKLSVLHSWRTTKRRKLPSQAKSHSIFQRLLQRRSLRTSWVFSFLSASPARPIFDVLTVVACRRKKGTARIWRASTLG